MIAQLSLALSLREDATFGNFLAVGEKRQQIIKLLSAQRLADTHLIYLWGPDSAGISHLSQAACHHWQSMNLSCQYLPLQELAEIDGAALLDGLEFQGLVCAENLESIAGITQWESALFNFYNRIIDKRNLLLVTANCPPKALTVKLPDLVSRLSSGLVFHLPTYTDEDKTAILQFRASRLGLELTDEVAAYLVNRYSRKLDDLLAILNRLDVASLEAKRRVTIPFIKQVLD